MPTISKKDLVDRIADKTQSKRVTVKAMRWTMDRRNQTSRYCLQILGIMVTACALAGCCSITSPTHSENLPFSIVVLPDTQNYTDSSFGGSPTYFYDQTKWIKENKKKLNIVMVAHVGDIVQNPQSASEWEIASNAFKTIDNEVPYILCLGNHDIANDQSTQPDARNTLLNDYFPPSRLTQHILFGENSDADTRMHFLEPDKSDNYYVSFTGGGMDFLIIALEFKPRDVALTWPNKVIDAHPDHRCIVLTHGYLDASAKRNMGTYDIKGNVPQEIWGKLVSQHKNVFLVLCGHILGESVLTSTGVAGNRVHQILVDYQNDYVGNGGQGYLRIMTFFPDKKKIENLTYSPSLGTYLTRPKSQFSLEYE